MRLVQVLIPEGARASVLAALEVEGVELVSVTVDYEPEDALLGNEPVVNVLLGVPRGQPVPPDLAQRWDDALSEEFGRDVVVRVGFVEAQVSDPEPPNPPFEWPARSTSPPTPLP